LIEEGELRLIGMKNAEMEGLSAFIFSRTVVTLLSVRPRRTMVAGDANAREMTVSTPRLLVLPPVISTIL